MRHLPRFASFDLGTGVFGYIVAERTPEGTFNIIQHDSRFVQLGEGGVHHITPEAYNRAYQALYEFTRDIRQIGVEGMAAVGTETLRMASNGPDFVNDVRQNLGLNIDIINGHEEARLNYIATRNHISPMPANSLIMDIGGGSVEFVIGHHDDMLWSGSFKTGMMLLRKAYYRHDPLAPADIADLKAHLAEQFVPLKEALSKFQPVRTLIGNMGTFETLARMIIANKGKHTNTFSRTDFEQVLTYILPTTLAQRQKMPIIPQERKGHIPVTMLLINEVVEIAHIEQIIASKVGVRHGLLYDRFG